MIRLKIKEKNGNDYLLEDSKKNNYELSFEFYDIEKEPKKNDYINISAELLNPKYQSYTTNFYFGGLENICGRKEANLNDIDVIMIEMDDKEIYLKRLYG